MVSKDLVSAVLPRFSGSCEAPRSGGFDADADLLARIAVGDHAGAISGLMARHGASVYRYCREALRDGVLAEDVHQQVFIEAYRDLSRFRGQSTVRVWLFAIARHRVLDATRQRRRAQRCVDDSATDETPDPEPLPGERLDDARLREALVASLGALPEATRTALLLRFQHGFTFAEMAAICREQPSTLNARVTRALPVLRRCIEARIGGLR